MTSNESSSPLYRWMRFFSVGAIGLGVQLWTLLLLLHLGVEPVISSLLAVEAAILHNFSIHRAWTWKDRPAPGLGVELRRLARFHLSCGGTSLLGHALVVPVSLHMLGLTPLMANLVAVGVCGVANFLLADLYAFSDRCIARPPESTDSLPTGKAQTQPRNSEPGTWNAERLERSERDFHPGLLGLAARGRSTFSELRRYAPVAAAMATLTPTFGAERPQSV